MSSHYLHIYELVIAAQQACCVAAQAHGPPTATVRSPNPKAIRSSLSFIISNRNSCIVVPGKETVGV